MKDYSDKDVEYPQDLWIVRRDIFIHQYREIPDQRDLSNVFQFLGMINGPEDQEQQSNSTSSSKTNIVIDFDKMKFEVKTPVNFLFFPFFSFFFLLTKIFLFQSQTKRQWKQI